MKVDVTIMAALCVLQFIMMGANLFWSRRLRRQVEEVRALTANLNAARIALDEQQQRENGRKSK